MATPESDTIAGIVLAGGRSQRMGGRDKALVPLGGKPLIARAIDRLAPQVATLAISANGDAARFAPFGRPVFADVVEGHLGPLAGILSAMRWAGRADGRFTHVATAAADTPFFPADLVARLAGHAASERTIAMARSESGSHPVFALWPLALADDLAGWLERGETLKVGAWAQRHDLAFCDFPVCADGADPFFNINTPDDLSAAEAILKGATA